MTPDVPRVVFFGMSGSFSEIPLELLAKSELRPVLVVEGVEDPVLRRRPRVEHFALRPSALERAKGKIRGALGHTNAAGALAEKARNLGLPVLATTDANDPRALGCIARYAPDVFLVAGFPHLLSAELLSLARFGGLNIHPGRLPKERGRAPLFWALKEGKTEIGYSIHVLDRGEDSGDVVHAGQIAFEPGLAGEAILALVATAAAPVALRSLRSLLRGDLVRIPQPREGAGRRPRPRFRDGLIDPSRPARDVYTFVAGCASRYSLFVECGGDRFFIRGAASYDPEAKSSFEYALLGDRLILRCNPGVVELELKDEGALFAAEY